VQALGLRRGVPEQIPTDSKKVFTGRFFHPPVEVLVDAICREHGIEHLLTQPRSPTTTEDRAAPSEYACRIPLQSSCFHESEGGPAGIG
jgi:hypothetical protein